ncbi:uncharacterized protein LOC129588431 [Paramacrobiotus metropolitanus]|uniref:uncharacterized protein LOC129588431 n=1 Tax=Paramacrobiotus metropolitanus TaxID=2943436 RepID=UPI00244629C8|nr:uncharacterized protein LOC129588431 [Paramacrobiotus metropolitanus]
MAQFAFALLASFVACAMAAPMDMSDSASPQERAIIRRVTAQRAIFPGLGGFGLGGLGLGGFGYGLGGLGYGGLGFGGLGYGLGGLGYGGYGFGYPGLFFDEEPSGSSDESQMDGENDEMMDDHMKSYSKGDFKTIVIPGNMIHKMKVKLYNKPGMESSTANMATSIDATNTAPMTSTSNMNQKVRIIRVPTSVFRRFVHHARQSTGHGIDTDHMTESGMTDIDNEVPMEASIDADNTEQEEATNVKGMKVLRVPHEVFTRLHKTIPKRVQTAVTDQDLDNIVKGKEKSMVRVLPVPHSIYKKLKEQYQSAYESADEGSSDDSMFGSSDESADSSTDSE